MTGAEEPPLDLISFPFLALTWFLVPADEDTAANVSFLPLRLGEEATGVFPPLDSTARGTMGECEAADFFDFVLRCRKNLDESSASFFAPRRSQLARGPAIK